MRRCSIPCRSVAVLLGFAASTAWAEDAVPLLGYCAPPTVPGCAAGLKGHPERVAACAPELDGYVASVFHYRACLTREMERAVQEANGAIAKLRCAQKRGPC